MRNKYPTPPSSSHTITFPLFDGFAFLDMALHDYEVGRFMNKQDLDSFASEIEFATRRASGDKIEIEELFDYVIPSLILSAYMNTKYPQEVVHHSDAHVNDGDKTLSDGERMLLIMLEFWAVVSQADLRKVWAEYKLAGLTTDQVDGVEAYFVEHGMAEAIRRCGGVVGLFRLGARDSFHAYIILLAALDGLHIRDLADERSIQAKARGATA